MVHPLETVNICKCFGIPSSRLAVEIVKSRFKDERQQQIITLRVSSAQRQMCCIVRCMTQATWAKVVEYKYVNLFTIVTCFYRSKYLQHMMNHALWITHSPTADNGGFLSFQPTSASRTVQKGTYRGVQNKRVHSYGLFSLMVKTFCSGSYQADCVNFTFYIHEMSKKWKRKQEGMRGLAAKKGYLS